MGSVRLVPDVALAFHGTRIHLESVIAADIPASCMVMGIRKLVGLGCAVAMEFPIHRT